MRVRRVSGDADDEVPLTLRRTQLWELLTRDECERESHAERCDEEEEAHAAAAKSLNGLVQPSGNIPFLAFYTSLSCITLSEGVLSGEAS